MKKKIFCVLAACMLAAGCSQGESTPEEPIVPTEQTKIPINVATSVWTRATDSSFEQNDQVGLYVVNYNGTSAGSLQNTGNYIDNMRLTYTSAWKPDTPIYWKDQTTKADFYCYYPYTAVISNVSLYAFAVKADQSNVGNYKASDFMWGKREGVSPTTDPVQLTVKHAMSNLIIKLQAGNGFTEDELSNATVTILGLKPQANINLTTGVVTATGNATDMTPLKETGQFRALVVPQRVDNAALIQVTVNGIHYTLTQTMNFETNKQHSCTVTVNRNGSGFDVGIGGWDTDDTDHGGSAE